MQLPRMGRYLTNSSRFFTTYPFVVPLTLSPPTLVNAATLWTNMPAARTEFPSTAIGSVPRRIQWDLTYRKLIAIAITQVNTVGAAGSKLTLEYSTDGGANWNQFTNEAFVLIDSAAPAQLDAQIVLTDAEKTDVLIRCVGVGGDGVADPNVSTIAMWSSQAPVSSANQTYAGEYVFYMPGTNKLYSLSFRLGFTAAATPAWTNMPLAETQYPVGNMPVQGPIATCPGFKPRRVRLICPVQIAGSANAQWSVKYSTDGGVTYKNFDSETDNNGTWVAINTTGIKVSPFVNVDLACANALSVRFAMWGKGGDGVADPSPTGATPSSNTGTPIVEFETYERSDPVV